MSAALPVVPGWRTMAVKRRADHVAVAIAAELDLQRAVLNAAVGVRAVTLTVRFKTGTETPRCVVMQMDTERMLDNGKEVE